MAGFCFCEPMGGEEDTTLADDRAAVADVTGCAGPRGAGLAVDEC